MKTRPLGRSGLETPVVIFGAWQLGGWFWGEVDERTAVDAVHRALAAGMNAIDTAPAYGLGRSEEVLGRALRGRRGEAFLMTKCGLRWDDDRGEFDFDVVMPDGSRHPLYRNLRPDSVRHELEQSLRRLQTDYVDLFQCHWPDPTTPIADTMGEMARLHREGKIRAVGVSNFTPDMMREAEAALGTIPLASDQPRYNLMDRAIEKDVLPYLRERRIGCIVYSPLDQGLLTGTVTEDRKLGKDDLRGTRWKFNTENRRLMSAFLEEHLAPVARRHNATMTQTALAWVIGEPGVTAAIAGARDARQIEENAGAANVELSAPERAQLGEAFQSLTLVKPAAR